MKKIAPPIAAAPVAGDAAFVLRDRNVSAFFTASGFALAMASPHDPARPGLAASLHPPDDPPSRGGWGLHWTLPGAGKVLPRPDGRLPGRVSYLAGDESRWKTDLPSYSRMVYDNVYPGVDLEIESRHAGIEYRFEPGLVLLPGRRRRR